MAPAVLRLVKFTTKAVLAGGAVYVAYDYGLLGSGNRGEEALKKTTAAVPPAVHEWADYFGLQLPSTPKLDFSLCESWNWGVQKSVSALSSAPTKVCEYTADSWKYVKDLVK
ncbi:PREDICTED: MICOS complex subunit MIC13 [Nanorana parkeri]|uniref:MICOS complex subunit MIC13 n=1 Tax=Nanorana parkeri TaxID=125878 RepID=UPI000854F87C|nr:PREDICTED: MICOS complex subunit MIC13 [Nanorana parkeri]